MEKKTEDATNCRVECSLDKIVLMWKKQRSEPRQQSFIKLFVKEFVGTLPELIITVFLGSKRGGRGVAVIGVRI